jgi:hypothetical protein
MQQKHKDLCFSIALLTEASNEARNIIGSRPKVRLYYHKLRSLVAGDPEHR